MELIFKVSADGVGSLRQKVLDADKVGSSNEHGGISNSMISIKSIYFSSEIVIVRL